MEFKDTNLTIGDGVTSLVYASAINVILARTVSFNSFTNYIISIGLIMFIFIDWLSRIGIPMSFPEEDQQKRKINIIQLLKGLIEVIVILLLMKTICFILFSDLVPGEVINKNIAFAGFLLMSFFWNIIVLYIMQKLSVKELIESVFNGNVFDLEGADEYTGKFKKRIFDASNEFNGISKPKNGYKTVSKTNKAIRYECIGRTIGQLLACHIIWVNLFIAITLIFNMDMHFIWQFFQNMIGNIIFFRGIILLFLLLIPTILFYGYRKALLLNEDNENSKISFKRKMAGTSIIILLILFYTTFNITDIIYLMIIQQTIFGVFLQYATSGKSEDTEPDTKPDNNPDDKMVKK